MKGKIPQRELVERLIADIDAARRKTKTAHTDGAQRRVMQMIANENWETAFVSHNLGQRRLRWLMSQGVWRAQKWANKEIDREQERGGLAALKE